MIKQHHTVPYIFCYDSTFDKHCPPGKPKYQKGMPKTNSTAGGPHEIHRCHRRYLMGKVLSGWTIVHPSNTDYILKNKFDQFQI